MAATGWRNRIVGYADVEPSQLLANPRNFRRHPRHQHEALAGVIGEIGYLDPVLVQSGTGVVIDGHLRVELAMRADQPTIPVQYVDLTDDETNMALATFDPLAAMATSDRDKLDELLREVSTDNAAVMQMLSELAEREGVVGFGGTDLLTDPDEVPPVPDDPITQPGDLWLLGRHRLLCGDSTKAGDVRRLMAGERADMVFTDPPYGVSYVGGVSHDPKYADKRRREGMVIENDAMSDTALRGLIDDAFSNSMTVCKPGATWYVTATAGPLNLIPSAVLHRLGIWRQTINWVKSAFVFGRSDYHYRHEPIFYGWVEGAAHYFTDDRTQDTIWEFPRPVGHDNPGHPTAKPVDLIARATNNSSKPRDLILDPFGGSGSTLLACEQTNRSCAMMELDPRYCDVIVRRWENATGRTATRATDAMAAD